MDQKVKRIFRDRRLTPEQVARDENTRREVMREFPPLQHIVAWYEKQYGQFRGCEVLRGVRSTDLRKLFNVPADQSMEGTYAVGPAQAAELGRYLDRPVDLTQYTYRIRSQEAEMLPLEELSPVDENERGHEDAA